MNTLKRVEIDAGFNKNKNEWKDGKNFVEAL